MARGAILGLASSPVRTSPEGDRLPPEAEKITDHVYRIGGTVLDMKARSVTCEGRVNMRKGMIEYLAVPLDGKRHESVLVLDVTPVHLQVALLLLGLEPGGGLRFQGDSRPPRGAAVEVRVRWKTRREGETGRRGDGETAAGRLATQAGRIGWQSQGRRPSFRACEESGWAVPDSSQARNDGLPFRHTDSAHLLSSPTGGVGSTVREVRLEDLAWDIPRRRPMEPHPWIFTGTRGVDTENQQSSDSPIRRLPVSPSPGEASLIASFRDPDAVLNNPLTAGADDTVYKANERLLPPVGTPVTVVIREIGTGVEQP